MGNSNDSVPTQREDRSEKVHQQSSVLQNMQDTNKRNDAENDRKVQI